MRPPRCAHGAPACDECAEAIEASIAEHTPLPAEVARAVRALLAPGATAKRPRTAARP